jgi:hypothetical protein
LFSNYLNANDRRISSLVTLQREGRDLGVEQLSGQLDQGLGVAPLLAVDGNDGAVKGSILK